VELERPLNRTSAAWMQIVRNYCKKKLEVSPMSPKKRKASTVHRDLRRAFEEGEGGAAARLQHACDPPRPSLVKHLDVSYALREPRTRNVLHGFLCNSMPPEFVESCALALATQEDYGWLDRDWLTLHKRLFTNSASPRWQFLTCIGFWMRTRASSSEVERVRRAIMDFRRRNAREESLSLFPEAPAVPSETLRDRCETLLSVLAHT